MHKKQLLTYLKLINTKLGYIQYLTDKAKREKINQIIECQEGIAMASEVLNTISKDWEERCYRESILKYELDIQCKETRARREGKLEERQEVINLLKSGKPLEQIIQEYEKQ